MDDRLPTHLYVESHLRLCSAEGIPVYVLRKGERQGGLILLKVSQPGGNKVYSRGRDVQGRPGWMPGLNGELADEPTATAWIDRQVARDPDLWVIEVESRDGTHPFDGRLLG